MLMPTCRAWSWSRMPPVISGWEAAQAAGHPQQVLDELLDQGGRTGPHRRVALQCIGVGVRVIVSLLEPGEQVPQAALAGVRGALAVPGEAAKAPRA